MGTTPFAAGKKINIGLAAPAISLRPIAPGGLFSFWGWLGSPSPARGFQNGRALRNGVMVLEPGGGLCQLAGAIYFAGLRAGLEPVERHAHSADFYTDATRYTPLGADATVLYGFKDLRLRNPHSVPVAFQIDAEGDVLTISVCAPSALEAAAPEFRVTTSSAHSVMVETWIDGRHFRTDAYRRGSAAPT